MKTDVRERRKVKTLPKDLQDIANQMLQDKFKLSSQGEIVDDRPKTKKELQEGEYGYLKERTGVFLDPRILEAIQVCYRKAREMGGRPTTIYMSQDARAALLRDKRIMDIMSHSVYGEPTVMGMMIKADNGLKDDRIVLIDDRRQEILYDSTMSTEYERGRYGYDYKRAYFNGGY